MNYESSFLFKKECQRKKGQFSGAFHSVKVILQLPSSFDFERKSLLRLQLWPDKDLKNVLATASDICLSVPHLQCRSYDKNLFPFCLEAKLAQNAFSDPDNHGSISNATKGIFGVLTASYMRFLRVEYMQSS